MKMINVNRITVLIVVTLFYSNFGGAQTIVPTLTTSENYVSFKRIKKSGVTNIGSLTTPNGFELTHEVTYQDGLGRDIQKIQTMGSPTYKDIVQPVIYDNKGVQSYTYLPFGDQNGNGAYKSTVLSSQSAYYSTSGWDANVVKTVAPYSRTIFELSPLHRVTEQGAEGTVWQPDVSRSSGSGRTIVISYGSNDASTAYGTTGYGVRLWRALPVSGSHERSLTTSGLYASGQLSLTITKDENWTSSDGKAGTTEAYTDKEGRLVLKRTFASSTTVLSTYNVYDDMGNLSYTLPPAVNPDAGSVNQTQLDQYCYQYRYDERGRLIEKRSPSAGGWTTYVYNLLNQLVFSQDPVENGKLHTSFTKYDGLGRVIMTGTGQNSTESRAFTQTVVNGWPGNWEYRDNGGFHGYSNVSPPSTVAYMDVETVNYYDDYDIPGIPHNQSANYSNQTQGLLTASKVKVLGTSDYLWTVNYYDEESRIVKQYKQHYQSGAINLSNYDEITYVYNFDGDLTSSNRVHYKAGEPNTTIANRYDYDHMGRRIRNYETINADPEVLLSENAYNEIGQLKSKAVHNGLQSTSYAYNERGWLKRSTSDQFAFQLNYQDGTSPQYNGCISTQYWGPGSNPTSKSFEYAYDKLNRLTSGISTGMSETLTYDVMGNIQSLNRDGTTRNYFYNGNQLNYTTGATGTGTYQYDANGNITYDGRLGQTVVYNKLNLPTAIAGLGVSYIYDADGNRLKKIAGGVTTDYIDGIQYSSGNIVLIQTEEGVARRNGSSYSYEYDLRDNLQNVRYTFYRNPVTGQAERLQSDDYYAFGMQNPGSPVSMNNLYLYTGKELQPELAMYDYGARFYDPIIGRWNTVDPAEQFPDISPYAGMANNPVVYRDPNGRIIPAILIAMAVGGAINLTAALISHDGHISFKQGLLAFGTGAVAGAVGFASGGAALAASGYLGSSFLGGAISGLGATAFASPILGYGNATTFGTPYTINNWANEMAFSAFTGGIIGGVSAPKAANFWTGEIKQLGKNIPITSVLPNSGTAGATSSVEFDATLLPLQDHHYASPLNQKFSAKAGEIANKFGLDLNGSWNIENLPHLGRHPDLYHEFVLDGMRKAAALSKGNTLKFLHYYEIFVKQPVRMNPALLRKIGWPKK